MYKRLIFYGITIAAIVVVYAKFSELELLQEFFLQSNWHYLALVVAIQFFSYLFLAFNYQAVLKIKALSVGAWELFPITFVIQFISQALPTANISGQVFFIYYLKKYGLTLAEGIGRAILEVATLYVAYAVFFAASTALLFREDVFDTQPKLLFFLYAFAAFAVICIAIFILSQKRRRGTRLHWIMDRVGRSFKNSGIFEMPGLRALANHSEHFGMITEQFQETLNYQALKAHRWLFAKACVWQGLILMSHVLTLYAISISLGHKIPFAACFIAFTFAKFLSMVSIVPGAPGVFEGAMTLILISFGIDKSVALAATLLTRAFTFWLPMPIGWVFYGRYMKKFEADDNTVKV